MAIADERVSRRRLLKRAGIGAAAVGAGSMITATTASADSPPSPECIDAGGCAPCAGQPSCPGGGICGCIITVEGCCFCHECIGCDSQLACSSSSDCPPGWACAFSCCANSPLCHPHCGAQTHHNCINGVAAGAATSVSGAAGGGGGHHEEAPAEAPGHGGHQ